MALCSHPTFTMCATLWLPPRVASSVDDLRAGQWVAWRVKTRRRWVVGEIIEPDQQWVEGMLILEDDPDD